MKLCRWQGSSPPSDHQGEWYTKIKGDGYFGLRSKAGVTFAEADLKKEAHLGTLDHPESVFPLIV